ncbi:hypothetical protein [Leptolyngbya sp. Cla-17]|uniref:hypothetical protein n=1 Tax=Leptolyngbya sp. Cla-17 TaxID=2803751 RepID=UPI0014912F3E|nr:hypothetical protein [Leptolyngbya sp. Cla-17]
MSVKLFRAASSLVDLDITELNPTENSVLDLFDQALTSLTRLGKRAIALAPQIDLTVGLAPQIDLAAELTTQRSSDPRRSSRPTLSTELVDSPAIAALVAPPSVPSMVTISNLLFSGKEGDTGTFQLKLNLEKAPTSDITLAFTPGSFLVVDADGNLQNGTQNFVTFTPQTWNQIQTVWFIAEVDGIGTDRTIGNTIDYQLSGGALASGIYNLGSVANTYAPDTSRFDIDLDFRNDTSGFWTLERRAIAQKASTDWSSRIANEWTGLQLNGAINTLKTGSSVNTAFQTRRYVDDLVVFVNTINSNGTAGGYGGIEYDYGGWITSADLMPRVGQIAIDEAVSNTYLYNAVSHELGHTLGLLGLNWEGYLKQDFTTPQTAVFKGEYSKALNGGQDIPLQSQDGANPVTGGYDYWHPAAKISSILSYEWIYYLAGPTEMDFALLADSGYQIYGVNVPFPPVAPVVPVANVPPVTDQPTNTTSTNLQPDLQVVVAKTDPLPVQEEQLIIPISEVLQVAIESIQESDSVLQPI